MTARVAIASVAAAASVVAIAAGAPAAGPTGTFLITSGRDGASYLYTTSAAGGRPLRRLTPGFASGSEPAWSAKAGRIAFSVFTEAGTETQEIWTSTPSGGSPRRLTEGKNDENPSWSPNGRLIAFVRNRFQLWVMRADGTGQRKLLYGVSDAPSWTHDGKRIVYGNNSFLFSVSTAGGRPKRLGNPVPQRRFDPVVSPDGTRIAFIAAKATGNADLFVMRSDTTGVVRLTRSGGLEGLVPPAWSPNGETLLFVRRVPQGREAIFAVRADGNGAPRQLSHPGKRQLDGRATWSPSGSTILFARGRQLWTMPARGGSARLLRPVLFYFGPRYSRDGSRIAVARAGPGRKSVLGTGTTDIYVLAANGSNPRKLTSNPADDVQPAWSPDGKAIAFVSSRDQGPRESYGSIFVVRTNGMGLRRLVSGADTPDWSPDGKLIAYTDGADDVAPHIAVIRRNGTGAKDLTTGDDDDAEGPAWSPDGTQIAFGRRRGGVYVMKADGTVEHRVAKKGTFGAIWSPDGKALLVRRAGADYVLDLATGTQTKVYEDPWGSVSDWR